MKIFSTTRFTAPARYGVCALALGALFLPGMLSAASFDIITSWSQPAPTSAYYDFGTNVVINGTYQLPPKWAANIYAVQDGQRKGFVPISNSSGNWKTGSFSLNIGAQQSGSHTIFLELTGGEDCAVNFVLNRHAPIPNPQYKPECAPTADNLRLKEVYQSRSYTVGPPPSPRIVVTPMGDPAINYANVPVGTSDTRAFFVQNTGQQSMQYSVSGLSAPFLCVSGCTGVVAANETKRVDIQFVPTSSGTFNRTVIFSCTGTPFPCDQSSVSRNISGNTAAPAGPQVAVVSANPLDFGTFPLGEFRDRAMTIRNVGGGTLTGVITLPSAEYLCNEGCGYALSAGQQENRTIRFIPRSGGFRNDTATLSGGSGTTVGLRSNVVTSPSLYVTPTSWNAGTVNVGQETQASFWVYNTGAGSLSGTVTGLPNNGFSCVSGCTYTNLTAGSQPWQTVLRFAPTNGQSVSATAVFTNSQGSSVNIPLSGGGNAGPRLQVSTTEVAFGNVVVDNLGYRTLTFTNTGVGNLNVNPAISSSVFKCDTVFINGQCSSFILNSGQSQNVVYQFKPTAVQSYSHSATFNGIGVRFTGTGIQPSIYAVWFMEGGQYFTLSGATMQYGQTAWGVNQRKSLTVYINNTGPAGTVINYRIVNSPHFVCISGNNYCNASLPSRDARYMSIEFRPTAPTTYQENLSVAYDFGDGVQRTLPFSARGSSAVAPMISVSPVNTGFGKINLGSSEQRTFTVRNTGSNVLNGTVDMTQTWPNYTCVSGCTFNGLVSGGPAHVATIQFIPTQTIWYAGQTIFRSNGGTFVAWMSGEGIDAPTIRLTPDAFLELGTASLGSTVTGTIRVENIGRGTLTGNVTFNPGTHFSCIPLATGCSFSLASGAYKDVTVQFAPIETGELTSDATFNSNAGNQPIKVVRVHGTGSFRSIIKILGGGTDFGKVAVGKTKDLDIEIRNDGTVDFGTGTVALTGPFSCIASDRGMTGSLCNYNLPAGGSTILTIRFSPVAVGDTSGLVSMSGLPIANFLVTGTGVAQSVKFIEQ